MFTEYYSHSKDHRREIHFMLEIKDGLSIPDLTLKYLVLNAFNYLNDTTCSKDIVIIISNVDESGDVIEYKILNEKDHPTHKVAFGHFSNKSLIDERHIVSKEEAIDEDGVKSLLDRFSTTKKRPVGFLGKSKAILAIFFEKISAPFRFIDDFWGSITNRKAKELKWDINLLSEVCGMLPADGMTMHQALKYMSKMLERERDETADPILTERIANAAKLAEKIEKVRASFSRSSFKHLVSDVQESIKKIDDKKLLIPVGFTKDGKLKEMLIEIARDELGTYTIAFISGSDEMRSLFDREVGLKGGAQALRREITHVNQEDLLASIPMFVELETSPRCFYKKDATPWREIFLQNMKFHGSWVAVGQAEEGYREGMSPGYLSETIAYAKSEKKAPDEANRLELATRLRF